MPVSQPLSNPQGPPDPDEEWLWGKPERPGLHQSLPDKRPRGGFWDYMSGTDSLLPFLWLVVGGVVVLCGVSTAVAAIWGSPEFWCYATSWSTCQK